MPQSYTPEFKKKIVRLHEEEGRTYKSITAEYGVSKAMLFLEKERYSKLVFCFILSRRRRQSVMQIYLHIYMGATVQQVHMFG